MAVQDLFPASTIGLPSVGRTHIHRLRDGDTFAIEIAPAVNRLAGADLRMIAYNGSIPGPTLHVDQGSEIEVEVTNYGDIETTVHWHGLRLDNRYDGVPHDTQAPIEIGASFTYRLRFPDAGFYWYHPHLREDYGQEMGMYGTIIVEPADPSYWPRVDRQLAITLDDVLIEDGRISPFSRSGPNFTAMGRFGNVYLINGLERLTAEVTLGEVVRLNLVNTANTRLFNVAIPGARMKLVGGDSGRYEHERFVDTVLLAPSERAVVDVRFERGGALTIEHRTPDGVHDLGSFVVTPPATEFDHLRSDPELNAVRNGLAGHWTRPPDKILAFQAKMPLLYGDRLAAPGGYACPMHPEVTADEPGRCPKCGMKLVPVQAGPSNPASSTHEASPDTRVAIRDDQQARAVAEARRPTYACPMHPDQTGFGPTECPICGMWLTPLERVSDGSHPSEDQDESSTDNEATPGAHLDSHLVGDGLEWEDLMPAINRDSNTSNMFWCVVDTESGAENGAISWAFTVGDRIKIRLVNELESDHPMHHPFHIHGAGRFLVLARDGESETNLAWKDTVLVPAGQTVDILLDVTNPGRWMAHCHIAEHVESGMMFSFDVAPSQKPPSGT